MKHVKHESGMKHDVREDGRMSEDGVFWRFLRDPSGFDPEKIRQNEFVQPDGTVIAKIPKLRGRITRRKKQNSDQYYIELITGRSYDPVTRQNRNTKTIIGTDISGFLKGMMVANERYHDFFNANGKLIHDPMGDAIGGAMGCVASEDGEEAEKEEDQGIGLSVVPVDADGAMEEGRRWG